MVVRRVDAGEVLSYWFGGSEARPLVWCAVDAAVAGEIQERFGTLVQSALAGRLRTWNWSLRGRLALIILLDVFPRHLWPGRPDSLEGDQRAQGIALSTLASRRAGRLEPDHRALLYLPLLHAEDPEMLDRAVDGYKRLADLHTARFRPLLERALERQEMINHFGRLPHRNALLHRKNSRLEAVWLATEAPDWVVARLPAKPKTP